MAKSLFSSSWYRVADLKPRLRAHARIHRQRFRGETWYILQDPQSGRFHRVSPAAYLLLCLMNGRRTLHEIWELVCQRLGDDPPTQDDTIQLLAQLHAADLLHGGAPPDMTELAERSAKHKRRSLMLKLRNPLALRFPLVDPDRFLEATMALVRPLFSLAGLLVWVCVVVTGAALALMHWSELTANVTDRVLSAENIALILLVYPVIKALHELGHGYATKVWGGEVHEMGIMLLVLMPVPYVDASASSAFRGKWRRALVGSAGIMVEIGLAAIAMIVWLLVEPGMVRAVAFNVMLIGGVSTVLFNGNPLLRFDGYYVLCDLVEIPNLGTRANRYIFYLIQRHLFRVADVVSPATTAGERVWFVCYGLAAFVYRVFIVFAISLFVATQLFFIGVVLAIWAVAAMFVWPLLKGIHYLATSTRLRERRARACTVSGAAVLVVLTAVFLLPLPFATVAEGIVWVPEHAAVRAKTDGMVTHILAPPNQPVMPGRSLVALEDPMLAARVSLLKLQRRELALRLDAIMRADLVQADILREQLQHTEATLELNEQRARDLTVRAERAGQFVVPQIADLPGRYVRNGDLLGYVFDDADTVVRVVLKQGDVDLVRQRTEKVEVRFAEHLDRVAPAYVQREIPAAIEDLPSMALSTQGGGQIALDPLQPERAQALEKLFQFDIRVSSALRSKTVGGRVYVRFDHGREAIGWRLYRSLRQLFLDSFHV